MFGSDGNPEGMFGRNPTAGSACRQTRRQARHPTADPTAGSASTATPTEGSAATADWTAGSACSASTACSAERTAGSGSDGIDGSDGTDGNFGIEGRPNRCTWRPGPLWAHNRGTVGGRGEHHRPIGSAVGHPGLDRRGPRVHTGGRPLHGRLTGRRRPGTAAPGRPRRWPGSSAGCTLLPLNAGSVPCLAPGCGAGAVRGLAPADRDHLVHHRPLHRRCGGGSRQHGRDRVVAEQRRAALQDGRPRGAGLEPDGPGDAASGAAGGAFGGARARRAGSPARGRGGLDGHRRHAGRIVWTTGGSGAAAGPASRTPGPRCSARGRGARVRSACGQHLHDRARVRRVRDPRLWRPGERGTQAEPARACLG